MASDASALKTTVVHAAVLAVLILALPSLACQEEAPAPAQALVSAPAPAPAPEMLCGDCDTPPAPPPATTLVPAPAPAPVALCHDCDTRCQARSTCEAYVAAAGCGSACNVEVSPACTSCKSEVLQRCTTHCNNDCAPNDCASSCSTFCSDVTERTSCRNECSPYSFYNLQVKLCKKCEAGAATRCIDACTTECKANCISG